MADFVIYSPDGPTLQAAAVSMGFWSAATGAFVTEGPIPGDPDSMASFFLNIVGAVQGVAGYWARLRINGNDPFKSGLLTIPATLTVYSLVVPTDGVTPAFWSSDGVTPAPGYVAGIGVIA